MRATTSSTPVGDAIWSRWKDEAEEYIGKTIVAVEFSPSDHDKVGDCLVLVLNDGSKMFVNIPWGSTFDGTHKF